LIRCPNHEKVKNGDWEHKYDGDQTGTSKNSYIVPTIKDEFGRKIVGNNGRDTKKNERSR
jgi:hypothetical protein